MNYSNPLSTVSRMQDQILLAFKKYPGGIARRRMADVVKSVELEKGESFDDQLRLAITGLSIRGVVVSLPEGLVKLAEVA